MGNSQLLWSYNEEAHFKVSAWLMYDYKQNLTDDDLYCRTRQTYTCDEFMQWQFSESLYVSVSLDFVILHTVIVKIPFQL